MSEQCKIPSRLHRTAYETVLIVDDNEDVREVTAVIVASLGYEVSDRCGRRRWRLFAASAVSICW